MDRKANLRGPAAAPQVSVDVGAARGWINGVTVEDAAGALAYQDSRWSIPLMRVDLAGGSVELAGSIEPETGAELDLKANRLRLVQLLPLLWDGAVDGQGTRLELRSPSWARLWTGFNMEARTDEIPAMVSFEGQLRGRLSDPVAEGALALYLPGLSAERKPWEGNLTYRRGKLSIAPTPVIP